MLDIQMGLSLGGIELVGTELHGLIALVLGAGEHDYAASHLRRELDGQVTETTDADDSDGVGAVDAVFVEGGEDGGTGTHQRRSVGGIEGRRDSKDVSLLPDGLGGQRALVDGVVAENLGGSAVDFPSGEAVMAGTAGLSTISHCNSAHQAN